MERIAALAHNTMVEYDPSLKGGRVHVPDAGSEGNLEIELRIPELKIEPAGGKGAKEA